jgi:hypothetical protein
VQGHAGQRIFNLDYHSFSTGTTTLSPNLSLHRATNVQDAMCTSPRAPQALAPATTGNSLARDVINIRLGRAAGADQAGMRRAFFKFDFANRTFGNLSGTWHAEAWPCAIANSFQQESIH